MTALGIELSKKQKRGKNLKIIWKDPSNFKKFAKSHLRGFKNYNVCLIGSHSEIMKHKNWREGSKREAEVDFLKDLKHKISTNIFIDGKVEKNDIVFLKKIISVSLMFDEHIIGSLSIFSDTKKKGVESAVLEDKCSAKKNYVDSKTQTYPTHKSIITIDRNNTESLKKNIADRLDLIYSKVCKKISVISITLQSEIKNIYMICYKEGKDREQVDIITNIPNLGLISNAYQIIKSDEVIPGFRHIKNIRKPFLEELSTYLQITQILTYPYEIYLDDSFDLSKYDVDLQVDFSVPVKVATISYDISTKLRDSLEDTFKSFGETATILSISLNNFEVLFTEEYFSSCNKKITDFCKASKIELEYIKTLLLNQTFKGKNLFNYNELDIGNFDDDNKNLRIHAIVREDKSTILCILKPVYEDFEDYYEDYFSGLFDNIFIMRDDDLKKADINEAEEEYLQFINSFASYRRALNFKDLNSAEIYNQMFSEHIEQNLLLKATNAEYPDMNNGYKVSVIDSRTTPPSSFS